MYQAIVFLPLLGFLIAGAISIIGARGRNPGGMSEGHDTGHHHAPAVAGGGVIHETHHDDGHGHQEPAAWGSRPAEIVTTGLLMISAILSWVALFYVAFQGHDTRVPLMTWIAAGDLKVEWALRIDTMTAVMFVVVNSVSALVHLYSIGYMNEDPYRPRFFAYPYGTLDEGSKEAVAKAGFLAAFGLTQRRMSVRSDRFDLPRVIILSSDRGWRFWMKTAAPRIVSSYDRVRRAPGAALRRVRG